MEGFTYAVGANELDEALLLEVEEEERGVVQDLCA